MSKKIGKILSVIVCVLMVANVFPGAIQASKQSQPIFSAEMTNSKTVTDADNNLHMVWQEAVNGQHEIFYANNIYRGGEGNADSGNDWNPPVRISYTPTDSVWPDIGMDLASGLMFVTWTEITDEVDVKYYSISRDNGMNWQDSHAMSTEILLKADVFDPIEDEPDIPKELTVQNGQGYYIVQFETPTFQEWIDGIEALGGNFYSYIPNNAFIVGMSDSVREDVEKLPYVRWVGIFQPAYKLSEALLSGEMRGHQGDTTFIEMMIFTNANGVAEQIITLGGFVTYISDSLLQAIIEFDKIDDAAFIPDVSWVQLVPIYKSNNDVAAEIMNVIPVWTHSPYGLTGAGQIVAVADTGLDTGVNDASMHDDFEGRIVAIHSWPIDSSWDPYVENPGADDGAADVESGHGTHVAGSVLGDGTNSNGDIKGMAHGAELVFQAVQQYTDWKDLPGYPPDGYYLTGIPADLEDLFSEAYNDGAQIHTNSWGHEPDDGYGTYDDDCVEVDTFIWENQDFVVLFAAGNEGVDVGPDGIPDSGDEDGIVDLDSMSSPGTAKNAITVGASESVRSAGGYQGTYDGFRFDDGSRKFPDIPINNDHVSDDADGMAAFSGRGLCDDGRIKPDIVAPGTNILSTRSSVASGTGWGVHDDYYMYMGGTSMSTPLTAGAVTLIRQYYRDIEQIYPSAALIKATLINGATDIAGQYPGGQNDAPPIPNENEGWGRVDLMNSIFPSSPRVLRYEDVSPGFPIGSGGSPHIYEYDITAGEPLRITLVWTDPPGDPAVAVALVNHLELEVTAPDGTTVYRGNYFSGGESIPGGSYDTVNNVENVYINNPQDGVYTVEVIPTNINDGPQPYALVVSGAPLERSMTVGLLGGVETLDPASAIDMNSEQVIAQIYDGLVKIDPSSDIVPNLAESWEIENDGSTWHITFNLRDGVLWHDRHLFTAEDVKYTFDRITDPGTHYPKELNYDMIDEVVVLEDSVVRFDISGPDNEYFLEFLSTAFLQYLTIGIVPEEFNPEEPIGTGPFKLTDWGPEHIRLEGNTEYFKGPPWLEEVIFRFYPETEELISALLIGELDLILDVPPEYVDMLGGSPAMDIYEAEMVSYDSLILDNKEAPFNIPEARLALVYGTDRGTIVDDILLGHGVQAIGPIHPSSIGYDATTPPCPYSEPEAEALWTAAGHTDPVTLNFHQGNSLQREMAEFIAEQLFAIGVNLIVEGLDWDHYLHKLVNRDFDMILGRTNMLTLDTDYLYNQFQTAAIPMDVGQNFAYYSNVDVDGLLDEGRSGGGPRPDIYTEIQGLLTDYGYDPGPPPEVDSPSTMPHVFIDYPTQIHALNAIFRGYTQSPTGIIELRTVHP